MKKILLSPDMKVSELMSKFKEETGCTLRVYKGRRFVSESSTLEAISDKKIDPNSSFEFDENIKVADFENKMKNMYGLTVQVALPNNKYLAPNDAPLSKVGKLKVVIVNNKEVFVETDEKEEVNQKSTFDLRSEPEVIETQDTLQENIVSQKTKKEQVINQEDKLEKGPNDLIFLPDMKVKELREQFKSIVGSTLRVYRGRRFADDNATLQSIAKMNIQPNSKYTIDLNMKVVDFEKNIKDLFGVTVQVALPDNRYLAPNDIPLSKTNRLKVVKIGSKEAIAETTPSGEIIQESIKDIRKDAELDDISENSLINKNLPNLDNLYQQSLSSIASTKKKFFKPYFIIIYLVLALILALVVYLLNKPEPELKEDLMPQKQEIQDTIRFNNILFERSSAKIMNVYQEDLERALKILNDNPHLKVLIVGHASKDPDDIGKDEFNLKLSKQRAEAVKDWLVKRGISENRIMTDGKGFYEPIASNDTEEGRKLNRRIEFIKLN